MSLISVKDFSVKYNVPTSTLYYMVNNGIIPLRIKKTKYGKRKVFNEDAMLQDCKLRGIVPPDVVEVISPDIQVSEEAIVVEVPTGEEEQGASIEVIAVPVNLIDLSEIEGVEDGSSNS